MQNFQNLKRCLKNVELMFSEKKSLDSSGWNDYALKDGKSSLLTPYVSKKFRI